MEIDGIGPVLPAPLTRPSGVDATAPSFAESLEAALREVREAAIPEAPVRDLAAAERIAPAEVSLSTEEAAVALDLLVEIRSRLLEAYREIQRMQV